MSATGKSRHQAVGPPAQHHHIRYPHTACSTNMWCPSGHPAPGAWGYRGGYAWGYAGGFRTPQLYPPPHMQILMQIQGASRSPGDQNQPHLPLGAPPLGLPISPSVPDSIFRRFNVPSQIATHHHVFQPDGCCRFIGGTVEMHGILSGCALFVAVPREAVGSGRTWSTIVASPFLNSCRRLRFSKLSGIFRLRFFHFDDFDSSSFRFSKKTFSAQTAAPHDMANTTCT